MAQTQQQMAEVPPGLRLTNINRCLIHLIKKCVKQIFSTTWEDQNIIDQLILDLLTAEESHLRIISNSLILGLSNWYKSEKVTKVDKQGLVTGKTSFLFW